MPKDKYSAFSSSSQAERGRTNVRMEREIFAPRKPMTKDQYESIKSWLTDTAETKAQQAKLKSDLARLKAAYNNSNKSKAAPVKKAAPKVKKK